jgi:hypothetical protein
LIDGALDHPVSRVRACSPPGAWLDAASSGRRPARFIPSLPCGVAVLGIMLWNHTTAPEISMVKHSGMVVNPRVSHGFEPRSLFTNLLRRKPVYVIIVVHSVPRLWIVSA